MLSLECVKTLHNRRASYGMSIVLTSYAYSRHILSLPLLARRLIHHWQSNDVLPGHDR